jgi:hypothetical protein
MSSVQREVYSFGIDFRLVTPIFKNGKKTVLILEDFHSDTGT